MDVKDILSRRTYSLLKFLSVTVLCFSVITAALQLREVNADAPKECREKAKCKAMQYLLYLKDAKPTLTLKVPPTPSSSDPVKHPDLKRFRRQAGAHRGQIVTVVCVLVILCCFENC
ncbi:hypothetical protein EB796_018545 [Bugula neritina]|uniref:Uncharacterized protein n=1 Tax=Bugula neritina TaxID=10212 RepID=A0A7J7JA95_BUGNE|nr:hypothetical protein EB796_018545 [Bugula neritina]